MSNGIAVSIAPGELRLLVARTNGAVRPLHHLATELPEGAVRCGLQPPNVADPDVVRGALQGLAREAGSAARRSATAAVLVPDAAVRLAVVPIEVVTVGRP